jgi:predicted nucleotide-binding protein/Zn-dependent protease with chaperone function
MQDSPAVVRALDRTAPEPGAPQSSVFPIPLLPSGQVLDVNKVRDENENFFLLFVWAANAFAFLVLAVVSYFWPVALAAIAGYGALLALLLWISWKLTYAAIYGGSIEVGPNQYPQIYQVVKNAAELLQTPVPTILILHGHGVFELFVAKRFTRRGLVLITSNLLDEFVQRPSSREFMMFVGRQLGHLKAGHFRLWFLKDVIGLLAGPFHAAWSRRCHFTADRIGLLVAGDLIAAEQALAIVTVGARTAPGINIEQVMEQRTKLFESGWSWVHLCFSRYPYMVDRITRLRGFASQIGFRAAQNVGAIPVHHGVLQPIPVLVIHGHDRMALLELKDYLHTHLPHVTPRLMMAETLGAVSLPEKFEQVASDVRGAIAILTPDDVAAAGESLEVERQFRARQNVVVEIGWIWGKLGRRRCLLLVRGSIEIPSDLSGIDCFPFQKSPSECAEAVRAFIGILEREMRLPAAA